MIEAWNIRGLNKPEKQLAIRQLVRKYSIKLMGVLETRFKAAYFHRILAALL